MFLYEKEKMRFGFQDYICTALKRAKDRSLMEVLMGIEGLGKSTGAAPFILEEDFAYYIRIGESYTPLVFYKELFYLIGGQLAPQSITIHELIVDISKLLTNGEDKRIIVFDDAGKLTTYRKALGLFHQLRDNTMMNTALVFITPEYFKTKLEESRKRGVAGIGEFYRRVQGWHKIPRQITQKEKKRFAEMKGLNETEIRIFLKDRSIKTVSELEIEIDKKIEERDLSEDD